MLMPGRKYSIANTNYRYGFNGKENDNDIENSAQDYGMRIYDGRLGRFLSVDPITKKYTELTPYQFASDRPIDGIDLDGKEYLSAYKSTLNISLKVTSFKNESVISGSIYLSPFKNVYTPTADYLISGGNGEVATFEAPNYKFVLVQRQKAVDEALTKMTEATAGDATAESIKQPELYILNVPKNKPEVRELEKNKNFWIPTGVETGSAKGDALVAMVQLTANIVEYNHGTLIDEDFRNAKKQFWAVKSALNTIQFGLSHNLFAPADLDNLGDYANYLFDGTKPQMTISTGHMKNGKEVFKLVDDFRKLKKFNEYSQRIKQKEEELAQNSNN